MSTSRQRTAVAAALFILALAATFANAKVFHSRESALRLAFPDADRVEKRELFLSKDEASQAEALARVQLTSRLVTTYVGWKDERIIGHAFIETHQVRTLPETILIVVAPDGRARDVCLLAFHEPPEYSASARWLEQFKGRALDEDLSLRGGVAAITGATMTANSITAAVRKTLAIYQVAVEE